MNDSFQDLIDTVLAISKQLEESLLNEKKFCEDIQFRLEQMNWEMLRSANELKYIKGIV